VFCKTFIEVFFSVGFLTNSGSMKNHWIAVFLMRGLVLINCQPEHTVSARVLWNTR